MDIVGRLSTGGTVLSRHENQLKNSCKRHQKCERKGKIARKEKIEIEAKKTKASAVKIWSRNRIRDQTPKRVAEQQRPKLPSHKGMPSGR